MTWVVNGFTSVQQYSGVAYSVIMVLLLLFLPAGLASLVRPEQRTRLRRLLRRERLADDLAVLATADAAAATAAGLTNVDGGAESGGAENCAAPLVAGHSLEEVAEEQGTAVRAAQSQAGRPSSAEPLLRVEGVTVEFGGLKAVSDVTLSVAEGEITALIGPNGAGKTTLFNAISRLQKLSAGRIWFAGRDITRLSPADTARLGMARTFQNLRIFANTSVLENVLVGCHRHERSGFWAGAFGLPHQWR